MDDLDTKIVTLLQEDGRQRNTEVARRLGLAEATVRKRIERLLREGVLRFGVWTDPLKVGYGTYAIIEIQVDPPRIERAAETLAQFPEIFFLGISTGSFDVFASALFRSSEHMYEFMTKRLTRVPGIQRTVTNSIVRILKREFPNPLAVDGTRAARASRAVGREAGGRARLRRRGGQGRSDGPS
jgi:Lrp/AsnC family transcriptional regulator for asnA, asnC and gidA